MSNRNSSTDDRPADADPARDLMTQRVDALERNLDNLAQSIGHDLRAPLRIAAGYLTMLNEDHGSTFDADARGLLDVIGAQIARTDELLMSLLALSEAGRQPLLCQEVDMTLLVMEAAATETDGMRLTLDIEPLGRAFCDRAMLSQAWRALMNNAIKFSAPASDPQITVSCVPGESEILYCIRDNGVGFDTDYSRDVFEPFVQSHGGNQFGGTGFGLALVKCIVERHGGRVWIESVPLAGTACYLSLPAGGESAP